MKISGYLISAIINGGISLLVLVICFVLALVPIPPKIAVDLIASFLPPVFICGPIAIMHYRNHLLGRETGENQTLRTQAQRRIGSQ